MAYDPSSPSGPGALQESLQRGERVLWQGKPHMVKYVTRSWPMSLFGMFFLGFALIWTAGAFAATRHVQMRSSWIDLVWHYAFPAFGIPFIVTGFALTFGHFIVAAAEWRNVEYMITNQRVLIRRGAISPTLLTLRLEDIAGTQVTGGLFGKLDFFRPQEVIPQRQPGSAAPWTSVTRTPTFECIYKPQAAQKIAEDAMQRIKRAR